jgi:hypothetical protein
MPRPLTSGAHLGTLSGMTVEELTTRLRRLPRGVEVLAFEPGCEEYCEREVEDVEWVGHRVYLHLGVRRDDRCE